MLIFYVYSKLSKPFYTFLTFSLKMRFRFSKLQKKYFLLLCILFVISLSIRFYFVFQTDQFTGDAAYATLRQVENIRSTGFPIFSDPLSFSGRFHLFMPVFHYIVAFFSLFMGSFWAAKIIPNVLASTFIFVAYLIAYELMGNRRDSLITAFICTFIPVYFSSTINKISVYSLVIPLFFLTIYYFLKISQSKKYVHRFVLLCFIIPLVSPTFIFLVLGLLIYLVFIKLEYKKQNWLELELILFATFLILWFEFLFFKTSFLFHGYSVIWQNLPSQILSSYFKDVSIFEAFTIVGILPFIMGCFAMYKCQLKDKDRKIYLLRSFVFGITILLWLKLVRLEFGLIMLAVCLSILAGPAYRSMISYFEQTKISFLKNVFIVFLLIVFISTSVLASFAFSSGSINEALTKEEVDAFNWIKENTPQDSVVLSTISEGNLISSISMRKNVADMNFMLIKDSSIIFEDVKSMYTYMFKTEALELIEKYNINYIYFSHNAKNEFDIEKIKYVDQSCFPEVYSSKNIRIYESKCKLGNG